MILQKHPECTIRFTVMNHCVAMATPLIQGGGVQTLTCEHLLLNWVDFSFNQDYEHVNTLSEAGCWEGGDEGPSSSSSSSLQYCRLYTNTAIAQAASGQIYASFYVVCFFSAHLIIALTFDEIKSYKMSSFPFS